MIYKTMTEGLNQGSEVVLKDITKDPPKVSGHEFKERPFTIVGPHDNITLKFTIIPDFNFYPSKNHLLMRYWGVNTELYLFSVEVFPEKFNRGAREQLHIQRSDCKMKCGF